MPPPKFEAGARTLEETIFSDSVQIEVPDYQREFSWDKDRYELFFEDLIKPGVKQRKFCGTTLRLDTEEDQPQELIDGQQRTTVAYIVMATLRDLAMKYNYANVAKTVQNDIELGSFGDTSSISVGATAKFKFAAGRGAREYFRENVLLCPEEGSEAALKARLTGNIAPPANAEQKLIKGAYKYFHSVIGSLLKPKGVDVKEILEEIRLNLRRLTVVDIVVFEDSVKFEIFEAVNARGMQLRPADLIKNHLMSKDRAYRDEILEEWDRCNGECDQEQDKTIPSLTDLIRYYWNSTQRYVTQNKLFERVRNHVSSNDDGTAKTFTLEIGKTVDAYKALLKGNKRQVAGAIAHA